MNPKVTHRFEYQVPRLYNFFMLISTEHDIYLLMLTNVKMPSIVGILTFISMINKISECLKVRTFFVFQHFKFISS